MYLKVQRYRLFLDGGRVAGGHEPGQRVEGGIKIKKGKLRGVESYRYDVFH